MPSSLTILRPATAPRADEKVYRPRGNNLVVFTRRDPEVLLEGPAGTGKSRAALEKVHLCCLKYPGCRWIICRKTRESITQSAQVTLEREVFVPAESIPFHHESQEYRYSNGSRIIVAGLDKPSRIMSSQYDGAYLQEATEATEADVEMISTRLRNGVMPYQQLLMDCNPDDPNHWLNLRCNQGKTLRLPTKHEDNPMASPEYIARLDGLSVYRYKRLRLGLWVAAEGMFFDEWNEEVHVCEPFPIPSSWTRWVAIDYGYSDPMCALWFARDRNHPYHVYIYREAYQSGLRDREQAQAIKKASAGERISWYIADPSTFNVRREQQKASIAFVYKTNGLKPIAPGVNARIPGWQTVRDALAHGEGKKPRLQVLRGRAPNLVRTIPSQVHDPLDSEDLADKLKSVKTEDHAVDALRYGLVLEAMPAQQKAKLREFEVSA